MTRFRCQLRLCVKTRRGRNGCEQITPPSACPNFEESDNQFPTGVEDISDKSKTSGIPIEPIASPPLAANAAPIHQRRYSTTAGPPSSRPYGLSSAHAIAANRQNQQQQQASSNLITDDER